MLDKKDERMLPTHTDPAQLANEFNYFYVDKIEKLKKVNTANQRLNDNRAKKF